MRLASKYLRVEKGVDVGSDVGASGVDGGSDVGASRASTSLFRDMGLLMSREMIDFSKWFLVK